MAIQYFKKMISSFYKNHLDQTIAILTPNDMAPPMAKSIFKFLKFAKQKRDYAAKNKAYKHTKKS